MGSFKTIPSHGIRSLLECRKGTGDTLGKSCKLLCFSTLVVITYWVVGWPSGTSVSLASIPVYLDVRTCEVFLCFVTIMFVLSIVLTPLFSLFYVTREGNRFLHRLHRG